MKYAALILALAGCAPRPAHIEPARLTESHCWWAVLRTDRSPDSLAKTFKHAYERLGFKRAAISAVADTSWVTSGPTPLEDVANGIVYQSRMVAYDHGDSTHFRFFVEYPPESDSIVHSETQNRPGPISLCGRVAGTTGIKWSPLMKPDGEEKLSVWRSR
jgi:hypothetical protein